MKVVVHLMNQELAVVVVVAVVVGHAVVTVVAVVAVVVVTGAELAFWRWVYLLWLLDAH